MSDVNPGVVPTTEAAQSPASLSRKGVKHWSEKEIVILVRAWCIVCSNPAECGTNIAYVPLWMKIAAKYREIAESEGFLERAARGCETKWKLVRPLYSKWVSAVAAVSVLNKSGYDEAKTLEEIHKVFKIKNDGKKFTHLKAVDVLDQYPKWMTWTQLDPGGPKKLDAFDREGARRGATFVKGPLGHKAAVLAERDTRSTMNELNDVVFEDNERAELLRRKVSVAERIADLSAKKMEQDAKRDAIAMMKTDTTNMDSEDREMWDEMKAELKEEWKKRRVLGEEE